MSIEMWSGLHMGSAKTVKFLFKYIAALLIPPLIPMELDKEFLESIGMTMVGYFW